MPARIEREWIITPTHVECQRLASEAGIAPLLAHMLLNRDIHTAGDVRRFLTPDFKELLPPDTLPNAVAAARRLVGGSPSRSADRDLRRL